MDENRDPESRRDFLGGIFSGAGKIVSSRIGIKARPETNYAPQPVDRSDSYLPIIRLPDTVRVYGENEVHNLDQLRGGLWAGDGVTVRTNVRTESVKVQLTADGMKPTRIAMRWQGDVKGVRRYLGDHWERSYGDAEWRAESAHRPMPWYFLAWDGKKTHAYGVLTRPSALCFWTADADGITLWMDVRCGGRGVELKGRELDVCEIIQREGLEGETPFAVHAEFCRRLCPNPRMPGICVYGTNDWYHLYGKNNPEEILRLTRIVADLAPNVENRAFSVIDAGWSPGGIEKGPFDRGNDEFGDMSALASEIKDAGLWPGIWVRPLAAAPDSPADWRLAHRPDFLDPSKPEVAQYVRQTIQRLVDWGYDLIKHDYTTWDLLGNWGFQMGSQVTADGWSFFDRSRTTAEIVNGLYDDIRYGAGEAIVLGCNTLSHLAAGIFEMNRIGDDTSGKEWERTRRMGINAIGFRIAQHGAFYAVDADVAAITAGQPWDLASQWLKLVAQSGTPLFISYDPDYLGPEHWQAIRDAFEWASTPQPLGEPLDWMNTTTPRKWRLRGQKAEFQWGAREGADPFLS